MQNQSNLFFKSSYLVLGTLGSIILSSCGVPDATQAELDITVTARDPNYKFSQVKTYTLPNTVVVIQDPEATTAKTITSSLNDFAINQVASHFNTAGYQRLTDTNGPKPDFFVEVSVMQTTHTDVYYSSWTSYWGGYYAPWYGAGFAYAPVAYPYVINSTLGSLIVNMTNPNQPDATTQKIPTQWVAVVNGAVDGSVETQVQARIESGLNEAFNQSPYLKAGAP